MLSNIDYFKIAKKKGHFQFLGEYYLLLTLKDIRDGRLHMAYENLILSYDNLLSDNFFLNFDNQTHIIFSVFGNLEPVRYFELINSIDCSTNPIFNLLKALLWKLTAHTAVLKPFKSELKQIFIEYSDNISSFTQKAQVLFHYFEFSIEKSNEFIIKPVGNDDVEFTLNERAMEIGRKYTISGVCLPAFEIQLLMDEKYLWHRGKYDFGFYQIMELLKTRPLCHQSLHLLSCKSQVIVDLNFAPTSLFSKSLILSSVLWGSKYSNIRKQIINTLFFREEIVVLISDDNGCKLELLDDELEFESNPFAFSKICLADELGNIHEFWEIYDSFCIVQQEKQAKEEDLKSQRYEKLLDDYANNGYYSAYEIDPPFYDPDTDFYRKF
jgi:hypothetical protein